MPYKYGKHNREFWEAFFFPFQSSFPFALVGYEMIIANLKLHVYILCALVELLLSSTK